VSVHVSIGLWWQPRLAHIIDLFCSVQTDTDASSGQDVIGSRNGDEGDFDDDVNIVDPSSLSAVRTSVSNGCYGNGHVQRQTKTTWRGR